MGLLTLQKALTLFNIYRQQQYPNVDVLFGEVYLKNVRLYQILHSGYKRDFNFKTEQLALDDFSSTRTLWKKSLLTKFVLTLFSPSFVFAIDEKCNCERKNSELHSFYVQYC